MKTPFPWSVQCTSPRFRLLHASPYRSIWIPPLFYLLALPQPLIPNSSPHIMLCSLLEIGRFGVNQLCHQFHIAKSLWWFAPLHGALWKSPVESWTVDLNHLGRGLVSTWCGCWMSSCCDSSSKLMTKGSCPPNSLWLSGLVLYACTCTCGSSNLTP